ncbi:MAG: radical SAM protein [Candidatus Omnitrophota bacterium]
MPLEPALGPLSLYSFAVKNGFDGDLLDFNTIISEENIRDYDDIVNTSLQQWLNSHPEAKIVGITVLFSGVFRRALKIAKVVKKIRSDVSVVIGGNHPSIFPKEIIENCPEIDYVVIGEGEEQFLNLLKLHSQGSVSKANLDIDNGIAYRSDGKVVVKEKIRYIYDLGSLGITNYVQVNFAKYHTPDMDTWYNPKKHDIICAMPITTSRACPYSCSFCSMYRVMGRKFRSRPVEVVLEELKILYYEHNIRYFRIMDDCSTFDKKNSMKLFLEIAKSDMDLSFEFYNGLSIRTLDNELIDILVENGLVRGSLPIESGSEFLRNKIMNKNLPEDKIYEVYKYFEKNIPTYGLLDFF